jgi:hypothetical protein
MEELFTALLDKGVPFAMLAAAIIYFRDLVNKKDQAISDLVREKDALNKELRDTMEKYLSRSHEAITNNTAILTAFKEALKDNA